MNARLILHVLLAHKHIVIAGVAALGLIMYAVPLDELSQAFAAPGGGAKPPKPPGGDDDQGEDEDDQGEDEDGDYGHTVKPPKPPKPNK